MNWKEMVLDGVKAVAPSLVNYIPGIGPVASATLTKILDSSKEDDTETESQMYERIAQDPKLLADIKIHALNVEVEREREKTKQMEEETKRLQAVNETIKTEATSGSGIQRAWRPFNGFAFGITLFCDYILVPAILLIILVSRDNPLPEGISVSPGHIPMGVYMLWTGVLGITVVSRGVEKVKKTKQLNGGESVNIADLVKTVAKGVIGK